MSLSLIKDFFMEGIVSKEDYAAALRGYQAAVDATKSDEREKAEMLKHILNMTEVGGGQV